jgi:hypothetical protein
MPHEKEIRVCMDIGNKKHHVAVGLSSGKILDTFDLYHTPNAITSFFQKIRLYEEQYSLPVVIAMEGVIFPDSGDTLNFFRRVFIELCLPLNL